MSFEKVLDAVDNLDTLLNDGPEVGPGKSANFLKDCQLEAQEIIRQLDALTVADVDAEFTEEGDDHDGNEED